MLVVGAHNLHAKNIGDTLNAYATLRVGKLLEKTQVSQKTLSPTWDEQFAFKFVDSNDILAVEVYSTTRWKAETYLGTAIVPLYNFKDLCVRELRCPLESLNRKHVAVSGDVHLIIQCTKMGVPLPDLSGACRSNARDLHPQVRFGYGQLSLEVLSYEDVNSELIQQQQQQRSLCFMITVDGKQETKSEISEFQKAKRKSHKRKHKKKKAKREPRNIVTWSNVEKSAEKSANSNYTENEDGDNAYDVKMEEEEEEEDDPYRNVDNSFYFDVTSASTVELTFYESFNATASTTAAPQAPAAPCATNASLSSLAVVSGPSSSSSSAAITGTPPASAPAGGAKLGWAVLGRAGIAVSSIPVTALTGTEMELQLTALPTTTTTAANTTPPSSVMPATTTSSASSSSAASQSSSTILSATITTTASSSTSTAPVLGVVRVRALYQPPFRIPGAHALHSLFFGCFTPQFNWAYGSQTKETWSEAENSTTTTTRSSSSSSAPGIFKLADTESMAKRPHVEDSRAAVTAFWDEDTLADAFSSQENMRFYTHFVYDSPHTVFVGGSEDAGPAVLVVAAPDSRGFRKILLWTREGERRFVALGAAECLDKVRAECPALRHMKLREARGGPELRNALRDYEASNTPSRFKVGVLYAAPGQRTEAELMANTRVSGLFERFLDVLGERMELCGWPHYDGGLDTSESRSDGTYSRYTTFQGIELMYHVPSYMPFKKNDPQQIGRKRHVMNDTVVVIFKERMGLDDVVDVGSFQSHCTCVYFVVSPVFSDVSGDVNYNGDDVSNGELFYAVNVVYKDDILPAPPFLPRDDDEDGLGPLLRHDKGLHAWIVKKIVNADKNTKISSVYSAMNEKSRSIVLSRIVENTQLK